MDARRRTQEDYRKKKDTRRRAQEEGWQKIDA